MQRLCNQSQLPFHFHLQLQNPSQHQLSNQNQHLLQIRNATHLIQLSASNLDHQTLIVKIYLTGDSRFFHLILIILTATAMALAVNGEYMLFEKWIISLYDQMELICPSLPSEVKKWTTSHTYLKPVSRESRPFCLVMLYMRPDINALAKLMGHESTVVLQRYLKQTNQDTEIAHRRAGPVDNAGFWLML